MNIVNNIEHDTVEFAVRRLNLDLIVFEIKVSIIMFRFDFGMSGIEFGYFIRMTFVRL